MRRWANSVPLAPGERPWVRPMPNNAKNKTNIKTPGKNCNTGRRMWFVLQTIKR